MMTASSGRRVGVNTWVWASPLTDERLRELAPMIKNWGFDLIELPIENLGDWDPAVAATLLADLELDAVVTLVMGEGRELVATDEATVRSTQDYLRGVIDAAHVVGSPVVAGPAYASVGRTWRMSDAERRDCYADLTSNLAPVAEHGAGAGVTIAVEPLNRYETSLINTVDQGLEALAELPTVGLLLDVYHMNIEETDIPDAIRRAGARIAHVQVSGNDRGIPGVDHLPWTTIVQALDDAAYSGPVCIESFTARNETIATAASIWRPLAPTQDAIAVDGLAHLRRVMPHV